MKRKVIELSKLILIKMSSLLVMAYCLLYLLLRSGFEAVGVFAAVTAIVAPIVSFSQFRFIEYISLKDNKKNAFSVSLVASLSVFIALAVLCLFLYKILTISLSLLILMILYKFFELFTDIYVSFLSVNRDIKSATEVVISRIILFFILTIGLLFFNFSSNESLVKSLLYCLCVTYSSLSLYNLLKIKISIEPKAVLSYIVENYSYGVMSVLVSLNSLLPRYFFIYNSNYKVLGIFSIIYLVSSNVVNLLQYPISINADKIKIIFDRLNLKILFIIFTIFGSCMLFIEFYSDFNVILFYVVSISAMFSILLFRGFYITYSITNNIKNRISFSIILSSLFAFTLIFASSYLSGSEFTIKDAVLYVLVSSFITIILNSLYNRKLFDEYT